MTRLVLGWVLLLACGGRQEEATRADQPGELDLEEPATARPPPGTTTPSPSSSAPVPAAEHPPLPFARAPRFRGRLIDIDVVDADLHNVFRLIAEAGGASIAVAEEVKGTITLRLRRVPWDQALDTVVRLEKLHVEQQGDVYLVTR